GAGDHPVEEHRHPGRTHADLGDLVEQVGDGAGAVDLDRGGGHRDGDLIHVAQHRAHDRAVVLGLGQVHQHDGVVPGEISQTAPRVPGRQTHDFEIEPTDVVAPGECGLGGVG